MCFLLKNLSELRFIFISNIFRKSNIAKLGDLGIAHIANSGSNESYLGLVGTLSYMAPDIFENHKNYDFKVDHW